ncbi:hypothetical protein EGR_04264 [Echinococcus granulosus]|uniref:Secreted protein n=1 Tax=Echinococcus granulosus TaxID=6210 RepID=W6UGZ2_ECHGR|nr:hypothetical protein EGR_04264 [Echinococcus granulosus]EUB60825.1 hypothetical protein EGR_04264 [Echinococcus granulosus]
MLANILLLSLVGSLSWLPSTNHYYHHLTIASIRPTATSKDIWFSASTSSKKRVFYQLFCPAYSVRLQ